MERVLKRGVRGLALAGAVLVVSMPSWLSACNNVADEPAPSDVPAPTVGAPTPVAAGPGTPSLAPTQDPSDTTPAGGAAVPSDPVAPNAPTSGDPPTEPTSEAPPLAGLPTGAERIGGIELMRRLAGTWTGLNNASRPVAYVFPMTVSFRPEGDNFLYGEYVVSSTDNVIWGFSVEDYGKGPVLAYRNGGYLLGLLRDSRTQLVEFDAAAGFYRFCAVKEHGLPVDGCNYIDAQYTFLSENEVRFVVTTRSGTPHVDWTGTRTEQIALPDVFPATIESQGDGSAPWPVDIHNNAK